MTIKNFDVDATTLDGKPIADQEGKGKSYGWMIVEALTSSYEDERNLSGMEKYKRGELAAKVMKGGDIELTIEELSLVKNLVGKRWPVQIVYQIYNLIEGEPK